MWLKILLAVIIILILLLLIPIIVHFSFENGDITLKIKYAFLKFGILPKKQTEDDEAKKKEEQEKKDKKAKKENKEKAKNEKTTLEKVKQILTIVLIAISHLPKFLKKIFKGIKLYDLNLFLRIGGNDASEVSDNFVKYNQIIHTAYSFLKNIITVEIDQIYIEPNFMDEQNSQLAELNLSVRPITILSAGIVFGFAFIKDYFKKVVFKK